MCKEHQISTRNTQPGERHTQRGTKEPQYENRKRTDILQILKSRTMTTTSTSTTDMREQCSRFYQNMLPEDGPVRLKNIAVTECILRTF
jgi:hypothetical protein